MTHLIVCCDGTWQSLRQPVPTNIARIATGLAARDRGGAAQIVHYDRGVGAPCAGPAPGLFGALAARAARIAGGAAGVGLEAKIFAAYRFLAANYAPGDRIHVFGFSRGAYVARSLCGLIYASGLVRRDALARSREAWDLYRAPDIGPDDPDARTFRRRHAFRAPVALLGCFDTVGMLGVPNLVTGSPLDSRLNRTRRFHDCTVNALIERARHACALDEDRAVLPLTPMDASHRAAPGQVEQMWFAGFHGGVGGGEAPALAFSDIALGWMAGEAKAAGLAFAEGFDATLAPDPLAPMVRPAGLSRFGRRARRLPEDAALARLHPSVGVRRAGTPGWRPAALAAARTRRDPRPPKTAAAHTD